MDFWQVIEKRHCVRKFNSKKEVAQELIDKILYAAKKAPSAGGLYPADFVVIRDQETKKKISKVSRLQFFIAQAPVIIVATVNLRKVFIYGKRGRELYAIQDSAAACENLFLATTDLGLSTCWVGAFNEEKIKEILNLPKHIRPLAIFPMGYKK